MSRLIDADKLIEDIRKLANEIYNVDTMVGLGKTIKLVDNQPTAYVHDKAVEQIEKQNNLIDKWEKRLDMLGREYMNNLRDKIKTKQKKFNKHMKIISRYNELEMCIKDLKQLGGGSDERKYIK